LYSYMFTHPGGKLLFMGNEIAQYDEWNFKQGLQWNLLELETHKGINNIIKDLNKLYKTEPALHALQFDPKGFEWLDYSDHEKSLLSFLRKTDNPEDTLIIVCNFTPEPWKNYTLGVPSRGEWNLIFNSDDKKYNGSGFEVKTSYDSKKNAIHGRMFSLSLDIIPLGVMVFKAKN